MFYPLIRLLEWPFNDLCHWFSNISFFFTAALVWHDLGVNCPSFVSLLMLLSQAILASALTVKFIIHKCKAQVFIFVAQLLQTLKD